MGLALVDVAVALALSPLTVRGLAVVSVGDGRRPLHALLVDAHAVCGRGLLTATALIVGLSVASCLVSILGSISVPP